MAALGRVTCGQVADVGKRWKGRENVRKKRDEARKRGLGVVYGRVGGINRQNG